MTCNKDLMAAGKPYPRTCEDCGLGPCKFWHRPELSPAPGSPIITAEELSMIRKSDEELGVLKAKIAILAAYHAMEAGPYVLGWDEIRRVLEGIEL